MLSTNLHQYPSAFSHLPAPNMVDHQHHHLAAQHMGQSPLDTLAHTSRYAALQFHQNRHVLPNGKSIVKNHRLPYAAAVQHLGRCDAGSVEPVTSVINYEPSAMVDSP
jgi:hypothetical protein